jgi:hypothetical protein
VADALDRLDELVDLEPQRDTVAERDTRIADLAVVVSDAQVVKLEDELAVHEELLVLRSTMAARRAEHGLVPATRRLHVGHRDHRLRPHAHTASFRHVTSRHAPALTLRWRQPVRREREDAVALL